MEYLRYPDFTGDALEQVLEPLTWLINDKKLHILACLYAETFADLAKESEEHFLPTPVTKLPTGKEKGKFLAIDVGGTNLRVGFVELLGNDDTAASEGNVPGVAQIRRSHEEAWPIEEHLKMDQAEDLFSWIGDCIAEVIADAMDAGVDDLGDEIALGITFSFPMKQDSLAEATLMPMGKGFAITSDVNLGNMLLSGYARHCEEHITNGDAQAENGSTEPSTKRRKISKLPKLRVAAITNDTVATFASLAYAFKSAPNSRAVMGFIVGTGCNATIPMKLKALSDAKRQSIRLPQGADPEETRIVINTEWTIKGTDLPLDIIGMKTHWDKVLDKASDAPGFQPFEYMTAGRYLGELVRLVMVDFMGRRGGGKGVPTALKQKNSISTTFLATVVAQDDDDLLYEKLDEMFPSPSEKSNFEWSMEKVEMLRGVARAVQVRSSALIAAATVGLLACVGEIDLEDPEAKGPGFSRHGNDDPAEGIDVSGAVEELVVGYTGGTISRYPGFLETCQNWIDNLVSKGSPRNAKKRVVLREATDGGIIGAAVLAGTTLNGS